MMDGRKERWNGTTDGRILKVALNVLRSGRRKKSMAISPFSHYLSLTPSFYFSFTLSSIQCCLYVSSNDLKVMLTEIWRIKKMFLDFFFTDNHRITKKSTCLSHLKYLRTMKSIQSYKLDLFKNVSMSYYKLAFGLNHIWIYL